MAQGYNYALAPNARRRGVPGGDPCADSLENQQAVTPYPYYSTVKFVATQAGASGTFTWVMTTGNNGRRAFSYGQDEDKQSAGYTAADGLATLADTNLMKGYETISGENVYILGIACQWNPGCFHKTLAADARHRLRMQDSLFIAALNARVSVELSLNGGKQTFPLGTIGMIPGAGGLTGGAQQMAGLNALDMVPAQIQPFATNGWPTRANFFRVPEGLVWHASGQHDAMFCLIFRQQGDLVVPAGGADENIALATTLGATANVTRGFNYPTELAAELKVFLMGTTVGPRSRAA